MPTNIHGRTVAELRAFFRDRDDHHRLCMANAPGASKGECDCYAKSDVKAHMLLDSLAAENARLAAGVAEWQPIETAPKDATLLLLWWPSRRESSALIGYYGRGWLEGSALEWRSMAGLEWHKDPTHWMPLPPPPAELLRASAPDEDRST